MTLIGYKRDCKKSPGGVLSIYLAMMSDIKSATLDAQSGAYSAIEMAATAGKFKRYEFSEDDAEFKESVKFENGARSADISIQFKLPTMDSASRAAVDEIMEQSYCGLVGIVKLGNGEMRLLGYNETEKKDRPLRMRTAESTTAKKPSDPHGEDVTLGCEHSEKSRLFTGDADALVG